MSDVFIVSGARTAIGTFGGSLKDVPPGVLAAHVTRAALDRSGLDPSTLGHAVFGQVVHTEPADCYIARVAAVNGGAHFETPAFTVNRLCGSGLQAIVSAAQTILLGDAETALAGGAESMSRAPHLATDVRWGKKMGEVSMIDMLSGALTDPFHRVLMGVTAENIAERNGITRDDQDALALESHRRAVVALKEGRFKDQIVPVEVRRRGKTELFTTDEHVRTDIDLAELTALRTVFKRDGGTVTAGNASGINDAAAAVILAGGRAVQTHSLKPLARLVAYGHAGVDPAYMGMGPVPAVRAALTRAGLSLTDMDVIESNEAFAAQACAVARELGFDPQKVNPNGSGISLGHPIGATGTINAIKAVYELHRTGGRYALVTMCIGGGQGIAAVFERC